MKKINLILLSLLMISLSALSQDLNYTKKLVKKLSSSTFFGRGYVKQGDQKAAFFLSKEMKKAGLEPYFHDFLQPYEFAVNTFPGKMQVKTDNNTLAAGTDYVVNASMSGIKKSFDLIFLPDTITQTQSVYHFYDTISSPPSTMLVVPQSLKNAWRSGIPGVNALVQTDSGAMWWYVGRKQLPEGKVALKVKADKLPPQTKKLHLDIETRFEETHRARNVAGFVRGNVVPDSLVVFVAHYDHLGGMGRQAFFPGASDNASGTSVVIDLARYYAKHPEKAHYTMAFVLVSGEEAGLLGSKHFAENPPFDLDKVLFLFNFDMVGTGSDGITMVNAIQFPEAFQLMSDLNASQQYFTQIIKKGESCNSDHCPFYEKGVPAVFIHTNGDENRKYHVTDDKAELLPFTKHQEFFNLMTDFVRELPKVPSFRK